MLATKKKVKTEAVEEEVTLDMSAKE